MAKLINIQYCSFWKQLHYVVNYFTHTQKKVVLHIEE